VTLSSFSEVVELNISLT